MSSQIILDPCCESVDKVDRHPLGPNLISFVYDELCDIDNFLIDEMNAERPSRVVSNGFADAVSVDYSSQGFNDAHNCIQPLLSLIDYQPSSGEQKSNKKNAATPMPENVNSKAIPDASKLIRGQYGKYTEKQINDLLYLDFVKGYYVSDAAKETGINVRTGQNYVRTAREVIASNIKLSTEEVGHENDAMELEQPVEPKERKYGNQKLFKAHTQFFLQFFQGYPDATLKEARDAVMKEFPDLTITVSAIHKHLVKHCALMMKKMEKLPERRNDETTLEQRRSRILEWKAIDDFDYFTNCVFIDEAGV
ncbi:hypothetical protein BC941DRAFT_475877 [Chlamydoabsidia padenii]|nr:hypothetical protein BC941DRAFT_475877 [Chlamydoabsidia padenii]